MSDWQSLITVIRDTKAFRHPERLDPNKGFQEQGVDSLDVASIFLAVEENYGIRIFSSARGRPRTFKELLDLIQTEKRIK